MNILVTIAARGGSKGVKNKNIRLINGKPLIYYTIKVAKDWGKKKRVVCSTDSNEIANIAKENGIDVPFIRPKELASDGAGKFGVIRHALIESERIFNEKYDLVVDLDVTSPIRSISDLDKCLEIYLSKRPDILISVVKSRKSPYFNMVEEKEDGFVKVCKPLKSDILCRQDAPNVFDINGSIYFYNPHFLLNPKIKSVLSTERAAIYLMDDKYSLDVDSELDFKFIEFLIKDKVIKLD